MDLEEAMIIANVNASRAMREALKQIDNQALWDLWQQSELIAIAARQRWLVQEDKEDTDGVQKGRE